MASTLPPATTSNRHRALGAFRWDLATIAVAIVMALGLVALLDTGALAGWLAANRHAHIDELVVIALVLAGVIGVLSIRRWLRSSYRLIAHEQASPAPAAAAADDVRAAFRHDAIGVAIALVVTAIAVSLLDTGQLADWIARQSHTRLDEVIVSAFVLTIGVSVFSIRRWMELSRQLATSETLYALTKQLNHQAAVLGELSSLLQACRSTEEAYGLIATRSQTLIPGSSGAVCTIAPTRDMVQVVETWGNPALSAKTFELDDCWSLRRGRANVLGDGSTGMRCVHMGAEPPARALCLPMMAQGEAIGLLYADTSRDRTSISPAHWSENEVQLLQTVSEQAALALANLTLRETLRWQSERDPLTGLYNRRYLEAALDRALQRASHTRAPVGVMMIDIDHFKGLNDTYGHEAGDAVLRALADVFRAELRNEDTVCRYGGEEFTMILPGASLAATQARAEALRLATAKQSVGIEGHTLREITISIGVAACPEHGTSREALLRAADAALYRAKEGGRNRVIAA